MTSITQPETVEELCDRLALRLVRDEFNGIARSRHQITDAPWDRYPDAHIRDTLAYRRAHARVVARLGDLVG